MSDDARQRASDAASGQLVCGTLPAQHAALIADAIAAGCAAYFDERMRDDDTALAAFSQAERIIRSVTQDCLDRVGAPNGERGGWGEGVRIDALAKQRDDARARVAELEAVVRAADAMRRQSVGGVWQIGGANTTIAYDAARAKVEVPHG